MPTYRKPTDKETEKLNKSRKMMVEGIEGEKDLFSKISTTMAKDARDQIRAGKALRETVPASAREGEAYQDAGYREGGKVTNKELFAPLQEAFDKHEKKKAEAKAKAKEEKDTSRSESMTMDEMKMKSGGKVSSASKRADGIAIRGKTRA